MSFSIRPQLTPIGPVHVRMTGVVRGDENGPGIGIVNAPTAAEATAELHRVARVSGADRVVSVAADYRRAALAGGTASTQWRIEVQAWGTAMGPPKAESSDASDETEKQDAEKLRQDEATRKARDEQAKAQDAAQAEAPAEAGDAQAATPAVSPEAALSAAPPPEAPAPVRLDAAPPPAPVPAPAPEQAPPPAMDR